MKATFSILKNGIPGLSYTTKKNYKTFSRLFRYGINPTVSGQDYTATVSYGDDSLNYDQVFIRGDVKKMYLNLCRVGTDISFVGAAKFGRRMAESYLFNFTIRFEKGYSANLAEWAQWLQETTAEQTAKLLKVGDAYSSLGILGLNINEDIFEADWETYQFRDKLLGSDLSYGIGMEWIPEFQLRYDFQKIIIFLERYLNYSFKDVAEILLQIANLEDGGILQLVLEEK